MTPKKKQELKEDISVEPDASVTGGKSGKNTDKRTPTVEDNLTHSRAERHGTMGIYIQGLIV